MSDATPFTVALGKFRSDCFLTQREVAKAMGVGESRVSKMERGVVPPTMGFVDKMFDSLKLEKSGHWYEKFKDAIATTRGKVSIEMKSLSSEQIKLVRLMDTHVTDLSDDMCQYLAERINQYVHDQNKEPA